MKKLNEQWKISEKTKNKMNINQLNINTIKDIINIMNEADFIQEMMK